MAVCLGRLFFFFKMGERWEFEGRCLSEDGEGTWNQHVHVREFVYNEARFHRAQWKEL